MNADHVRVHDDWLKQAAREASQPGIRHALTELLALRAIAERAAAAREVVRLARIVCDTPTHLVHEPRSDLQHALHAYDAALALERAGQTNDKAGGENRLSNGPAGASGDQRASLPSSPPAASSPAQTAEEMAREVAQRHVGGGLIEPGLREDIAHHIRAAEQAAEARVGERIHAEVREVESYWQRRADAAEADRAAALAVLRECQVFIPYDPVQPATLGCRLAAILARNPPAAQERPT